MKPREPRKSDLLISYQLELASARSRGVKGGFRPSLLRECTILRRTGGKLFPDIAPPKKS